jgi:hypothetical protein
LISEPDATHGLLSQFVLLVCAFDALKGATELELGFIRKLGLSQQSVS